MNNQKVVFYLGLIGCLLSRSALAQKELSREEVCALGDAAAVRYVSPMLTVKTPGHKIEVEADLRGAKTMALIVTDGGNGYGCDHTDLLEPRLVGPFGEKKLTALNYIHGETGWGTIHKNKSVAGSPLKVLERTFLNGIGIHSPGLLIYSLPEGTESFKAVVALDNSGTSQGNPAASSIQFIVYAGMPTAKMLQSFRLEALPDLEAKKRMEETLAKFGDSFAMKEYMMLQRELTTRPRAHGGIAEKETRDAQTLNPQATIWKEDRDPLDIRVRRLRALYEDLKGAVNLSAFEARLADLEKEAKDIPVTSADKRMDAYVRADELCREIALKNPLLAKIEKLLFITREALRADEFKYGSHMCDQYFGFHATRLGEVKGNGLFVLEKPFTKEQKVINLLENSVIQNGRMKGEKLGDGGFLRPDVSFDGKRILFSYTDGIGPVRKWDEKNCFHVFSVNSDGTDLRMITDGEVNDLFPTWLPNGRVVFITERRGGYGRCHGRPVPSFTLHSMYDDGTDIVRFSPHETNEWLPSVDQAGMIVYTRWDYVDRGFNQAHHPWITYPDGRDSRAINGNTHVSERTAPHMIMNVRAIPDSPCYVGLAAGHHTESRGSIVWIDPRIPDNDAMSQIKRVTPDQLFPEAEFYITKASGAYAAPWPLSEKYFLCVYDGYANAQYGEIEDIKRNYGITLLDAFGNRILIYRNPQISCLDPMPLMARKRPPVLQHGTLVGLPPNADGSKPTPIPADKLPKLAKVGLMNVYNSRRPFPPDAKITALRIWQVLPKTTPIANSPRMGMGDQKPTRLCLGTVPVEADGSAYFEVPVGAPIFFHALGEDGSAVQGMRSITYTFPGETLMCNGCHDQRVGSQPPKVQPAAMKRAPSVIVPEGDGTNPFNYPRLVQPVLDKNCVTCHDQKRSEGKKTPDLSKGDYQKNQHKFYTSFQQLKPYVMFYDSASFTASYTEPGKFGARGSKLYQMLRKGHHDVKLTDDEWRRLIIWLDSNCTFFGHEAEIDKQAAGEIVPIPMY